MIRIFGPTFVFVVTVVVNGEVVVLGTIVAFTVAEDAEVVEHVTVTVVQYVMVVGRVTVVTIAGRVIVEMERDCVVVC